MKAITRELYFAKTVAHLGHTSGSIILGGGAFSHVDNLFRIGTRWGNVDSFNRLVINGQNGNVGIGLNEDPVARLSVQSTGTIGPNGDYSKASIYVTDGTQKMGIDPNQIYADEAINLDAATFLKFYTNRTERMAILQNGNVGIGTSNPTRTLDIKGDIGLSNFSIFSSGGSSLSFGNTGIGFTNEGTDIGFNIQASGELEIVRSGINLLGIGDLITIDRDNTRNIGIGTGSPSRKLDVKGDVALDNYSIFSQGGSSISFGNTGIGVANENTDIGIDIIRNGELEITRGGVHMLGIGTSMVIDRENTRNIGIGVMNPDSKLGVNGTIHTKEVKVDLNGWSDFVFMMTTSCAPLKKWKNTLKTMDIFQKYPVKPK